MFDWILNTPLKQNFIYEIYIFHIIFHKFELYILKNRSSTIRR